MKVLSRLFVLMLVAMCITCGAMLPAWSAQSQTSEGQVILVQEWTLYIRTASGDPLSFSPYYITNGRAWVPAKPASTVLPALESGEWVKVMWTMDEREGRRRIDGIQVLRSTTGTTTGMVVSASQNELVIRPKDEPGTVTMNPKYVQREHMSVPDPVIAKQLATLTKNSVVTVEWLWDQEGRKRIVGLTVVSLGPKPVEQAAPRLR